MSRAASIPDERGSRELEARSWKLEAGSWKVATASIVASDGSPSGCPARRGSAGALGNSPCGLKHPSLDSPTGPRCSASPSRPRLRQPQPLHPSAIPEACATHPGHPGSPRSTQPPVIPEARAAGYPGSRKEDRPQQQESAWFLDSGSRSLCSLGRNDGGWSHPGSPRSTHLQSSRKPAQHPTPSHPGSPHSRLSGIQSFSHSGKRAALVRNPGMDYAMAA